MDYANSISPEEMKIDPRLAGGRFLGQIRCSRREQAKKSLPQQQDWLSTFSKINAMEYVGEMKESVSASQIRKRPDLERIFQRKILINDFDTVGVQDLSRLTRGGVSHGLELYFKFKSLGIRLVSLVDGFIDGDEKVIEAARRFQEARATAKATALATRRGIIASRKRRKIVYTFNVPFGVDRMITTEAGVPLFRLRNLRDRSQQKLSPDGSILLHTYPPNDVGERRHHVKQSDEFETLVPGEIEHVNLVNKIYRMHFVELRSRYSISIILNDEGILTRKGFQWTSHGVKYILLNPVYLNLATGDRTADGEFYKNGPSYPLPVSKSGGALSIYRAENEWYREQHDGMEGFLNLDDEVKCRIRDWQLEEWRRTATRHAKRRGGSRHINSAFILSGLLTERTTQWPMSGSGGSRKKSRAYAVSRATNHPRTGNFLNRKFNAEALERPVRVMLNEVLRGYAGIGSVAESTAASYLQAKAVTTSELPALRAQRDQILQQITFWVQQLKDLGNDYLLAKTSPLKDEVVAVGRRIASLEQQEQTLTVSETVDGTELERCLKLVAEAWHELPNDAVKSILKLLIGKMEINFETGEVDLELRIPSWAASNPVVFERVLEKQMLQHSIFETPVLWTIPLGKYRFQYAPRLPEGMTLLSRKDELPPLPKAA